MPLFLHAYFFYTKGTYKHHSFITFHGFPRRDSNSGLPYSKPVHYHLNHAAPLPEPHCTLSEQRYTLAEPRCSLTMPCCIIDMLTKSGKNCGSVFYTGDTHMSWKRHTVLLPKRSKPLTEFWKQRCGESCLNLDSLNQLASS